jgi:hypothetical protein
MVASTASKHSPQTLAQVLRENGAELGPNTEVGMKRNFLTLEQIPREKRRRLTLTLEHTKIAVEPNPFAMTGIRGSRL